MIDNPIAHYFLLAGEIIFTKKDDLTPYSSRLNTVLISEDSRIPVAMLGRAQQTLQVQFFKDMGDSELTVINVVILAVQHLGQFTNADFHAPPVGHEKKPIEVN